MNQSYGRLVSRAAIAATVMASSLLLIKIFAWWYTGSVSILAALVGSVVYRFIYAVGFYTKVVPVECLKLLTAVIVALAIAAPGLRRWAAFQKQKHSRKEAA